MTTDDLSTRARVEAEERYPQEPDRGLTDAVLALLTGDESDE